MPIERENIILTKTIDFALDIIEYVEMLEEMRKYVIGNQLLRSGTSIGANIHEAQNAESKADFIHKFIIAAKEMEETNYWLTLCSRAKKYPDCDGLITKLEELKRISNKIISTSKKAKHTS